MEQLLALWKMFRLRPSEPCSIVSDHNEEKYNVCWRSYLSAGTDEKPTALNDLQGFVHTAVLENLPTSIHKEFASYYHPIEQQQLLLLGNRKIYTSDKQKIQKFEQNKRRRTPRRNTLKPELTYLLLRVKMLLKIKLISSLVLNLMILKGKLGRKSTTRKPLTIQPVLWNSLSRESILMMSLKIKHLILEIEHQFFIIKNPCRNL